MTSSWGQGPSGPQQPGHGAPQDPAPPQGYGRPGHPGQPAYQGPTGPYGPQQGAVAAPLQTYGVSFSSGQPYNSLPQQPRTTNAGRTLGIVSIPVGVPLGPLGMVLGFISYQQAKRGNGPRALGVVGMVVGALSTALVVLLVLSSLATALSAYSPQQPAPDPAPTPSEPGDPAPAPDPQQPAGGEEVPLGAMMVGDCALAIDPAVPVVTLVDCAEWHQGQAYTEVPLGEGEYPGDDAVNENASRLCLDAANEVALPSDVDPTVLQVLTLTPDRGAWDQGITSALCLLVHTTGSNMAGTFGSGDFTVR